MPQTIIAGRPPHLGPDRGKHGLGARTRPPQHEYFKGLPGRCRSQLKLFECEGCPLANQASVFGDCGDEGGINGSIAMPIDMALLKDPPQSQVLLRAKGSANVESDRAKRRACGNQILKVLQRHRSAERFLLAEDLKRGDQIPVGMPEVTRSVGRRLDALPDQGQVGVIEKQVL